MSDSPIHETLALLDAARSGESEAAGRLLERYQARVEGIVALRLSRRRRDLLEVEEDVVQETLLDAFRGLGTFEPRSDGAFLAWLARLAENNVRDAVRRGDAQKRGAGRVRPMADLGRSSQLGSSIFLGDEPTPSEWAQRNEREEWLEAALLALPERERRAIELRRLCGLSFEEVARELELGSESSARSLFSRAMAALSRRL